MNIEEKISKVKQSADKLLDLTTQDRKKVLLDLQEKIIQHKKDILIANREDVVIAKKKKLPDNLVSRLTLTEKKIEDICRAVNEVVEARDVLFEDIEVAQRDSGIKITKRRFPLGVIAMIYESRPNVTIDAFVMAFKSGNAIILKGGKEIVNTNKVLVDIIKQVLSLNKIDNKIICDISGVSRKDGAILFTNSKIDCLIPRGGKKLIEYVKDNARVPVIITGASVVHAYVDEYADIKKAVEIIFNSKLRNTAICNALDVLLLHRKVAENVLNLLIEKLLESKTFLELRCGDEITRLLKNDNSKYVNIQNSTKEDYDTEFLSAVLAVRIVSDYKEAVKHIQKHSLGHSEVIITEDRARAEYFFRKIDSACVYQNTSTQFSDGGEFGFGGEIGISTQKLHARGPFAYKELTTYKYIIGSEGKVRP